MLCHIVCFKLEDPSAENCAKAQEVLCSMEGNVPQILDMEVGMDVLHSSRSYDIVLQVMLENRAALDAYQQNPYHVDVVKKHMHAVAKACVTVDFEL